MGASKKIVYNHGGLKFISERKEKTDVKKF